MKNPHNSHPVSLIHHSGKPDAGFHHKANSKRTTVFDGQQAANLNNL